MNFARNFLSITLAAITLTASAMGMKLDLSNAVVTQQTILQLNPALRELDLSYNPYSGTNDFIYDPELRILAANCPNLQLLKLRSRSNITVHGLRNLLQVCTKLRVIDLEHIDTNITFAQMDQLEEEFESLTIWNTARALGR